MLSKNETKELKFYFKKYSFRIDEQNIIDIQFLPGHQKPTFVALHPVKNSPKKISFCRIPFLAYK
jgi:hypothetical protein